MRGPVVERPSRWKAEVEARRAAKQSLREYWGPAYERLSSILFETDPVGINFESNTDEYEPEVEAILPRLGLCRSPESVEAMVHEEMVRWFDASTVGPIERYGVVAERIVQEVLPLLDAKGRK
jgi:hypothetical protein